MPLLLAGVIACAGAVAAARSAQESRATDELPPGGIPVGSEVVRAQCGACHRSDADGRMTRISYQRTTPEGWEQTIRRMVLLNGLQISPADAREAVRYLATHHGLAPDEARAGAFEVERRAIDYRYEADPETQATCNRCHSFGRVLNQRRTREEWTLLTAMHRGFYPLTDFQSFERSGPPAPGAEPGLDVDRAIAHLAEALPLETAAWHDWAANRRTPRLDGTWMLTGHEPGQGPVFGEVVVAPAGEPDTFETSARYVYPMRDRAEARSGRATVYTGFQWRGRSAGADPPELREVMFVSRDQREMTGRWFTGDHDERGVEVTLRRVGAEPTVAGVYPRALPRVGGAARVTVYGANLPATLDASAVDLGAGVTVTGVRDRSATAATLELQITPDAPVGARDLFVGRVALPGAVVLFDDVHRLVVSPATGLARVGGVATPKQYARFEARAYHHGPDGRPATDDDHDLGIVDVDWTLEEYAATVGDDDIAFVGRLGAHGVFEPADDGPNPQRSGSRNNVGDVWVVATLTTAPGGGRLDRPLRARGHLLVSVPLYIRRGETAP